VDGQKLGEFEGENFCPPAPRRKRGRGGKTFPQFLRQQEGKTEKSSFPYIEKNFEGRQLKKCREHFSVLLAVRRAETLGGIQSAKSSGFCSKKVLTSSSRHHHFFPHEETDIGIDIPCGKPQGI